MLVGPLPNLLQSRHYWSAALGSPDGRRFGLAIGRPGIESSGTLYLLRFSVAFPKPLLTKEAYRTLSSAELLLSALQQSHEGHQCHYLV
jgi:hypothetical protein